MIITQACFRATLTTTRGVDIEDQGGEMMAGEEEEGEHGEVQEEKEVEEGGTTIQKRAFSDLLW